LLARQIFQHLLYCQKYGVESIHIKVIIISHDKSLANDNTFSSKNDTKTKFTDDSGLLRGLGQTVSVQQLINDNLR
jgi:hypothetical protein